MEVVIDGVQSLVGRKTTGKSAKSLLRMEKTLVVISATAGIEGVLKSSPSTRGSHLW